MTSRPALPAKAYDQLVARDGERCHDCGATGGADGVKLDVEHNIPLWKVTHMTIAGRAWYNTLANLFLRCADKFGCHKRKTKAEAAERAHYKRLEKKRKPAKGPLMSKDGMRLT